MKRDLVEEVYVLDTLYDVMVEALGALELPDTFPDQPGMSREQMQSEFSSYCARIIVHPTSFEKLVTPGINEYDQFIKFVTTNYKKSEFIRYWDQELQFTENLKAKGIPITPTYEQMEMIYLFLHAFECTTMKQMQDQQMKQKIELATASGDAFLK